MTDYRNNAAERIALAITAPQTEHEVPALVLAQIAQAEATLALVEQQKATNIALAGILVALSHKGDPDIRDWAVDAAAEVHGALADQPFREALGLA
ncbi:hypothetical protein [Agromyces larvae]|uniref:ANTAR domain-containing protein n=1 Tax=Agromyces larvae TaxID=2929802 RepID=A0ABY4C6W3_9MICO|nr:hypothetical protein [Agromyces larvae]UOE45931.1 hypothetical protein MTO99_09380 [Agromyces larvae]